VSRFVIPDFEAAAFDAQIVLAMGLAYDRALYELHDRGQPDLVKEVIAKRIVAAATTGVTDTERLCEIGLGRKLDGT
jgi:hypothetical protein